jgi:hypothetical protein
LLVRAALASWSRFWPNDRCYERAGAVTQFLFVNGIVVFYDGCSIDPTARQDGPLVDVSDCKLYPFTFTFAMS